MSASESHLGEFLPPDQAARDHALDPQRSFIVQAPAGSGKTGLLVQRYLALLAQVDEPEEILAITFTRKATGEMRERVLHALALATHAAREAQAAPSDAFTCRSLVLAQAVHARDQQRGWQLSQHPSRLRILTIDALNASLTRQLPLLAGFGSSPRISDQAAELHRQAARRCLRGDQLEPEQYAPVARLLGHFDGDYAQAEEALLAMLGQRQQWRLFLHFAPEDRALLEQALEREVLEQLERLAQVLAPWRETLCQAAVCAAQHGVAQAEASARLAYWAETSDWPVVDAAALAQWQALLDLLLTNSGGWRKSWNKNNGFPTTAKPLKAELKNVVADISESRQSAYLLGFFQRVQKLPGASYQNEQWSVLADLLQVLRLALGHLQLVFQEHGQVDHTEVALRALQALGDEDTPTDLALKLDYRIRHLLVDEFQDTSRSQVLLLQRLTDGWQVDDGRSLFLVGDPMQSIYRFRQAEVGLFLQARQDGLGPVHLEPLALNTNFRSRAALVDWVNQVFTDLFPPTETTAINTQITYHASRAARVETVEQDTGVALQIHPLFGDRGQWEATEAVQIAQLAQAALARFSAAQQTEAVVAILVRRRQDLAAIIPALRAAGLAFEAVEIESLAGQSVVQDLYALTRALLHSADHSAWLALLRAPWCGLALADLEQVVMRLQLTRSAQTLATSWAQTTLRDDLLGQLSNTGGQRLERVLAVLSYAHQQRRRSGLRELVEHSWRALGGPASLIDARQRGDADAFFELLETLEQSGDCGDPVALAERLAQLYARPDAQPQARRLKLMTIHKAKGLEFEQVILPGLGLAAGQAAKGLLLWQERPRRGQRVDLLLGPVQAKGDDSDPIQSYLRELEKEQQSQEQLRLLYVATTRARQRLDLFGAVPIPNDGDGLKPVKGSALAALWPQVAPEFQRAWQAQCDSNEAVPGAEVSAKLAANEGMNDNLSTAVTTRPARTLRRLPADWQPPPPPPDLAWPRSAITLASTRPQDFAWAGMRARHIGTVVHAWLERIAEEGLTHWDERRVNAEASLIRHRLQLLGLPEEHLDDAKFRACEALRLVLADPSGRWILGPHPQAQCEYALNAWLDGRLQTLIIDRSFIDSDGTCWIIDYKTSALDSTADPDQLAAFIGHERQRYQAQLQNYARVLAALDEHEPKRPIRAALYLPLMQLLIELDVS